MTGPRSNYVLEDAKKNKNIYVDTCSLIPNDEAHDSYWSFDGLHYSDKGYDELAQIIYKNLINSTFIQQLEGGKT